MSSEAAGARRRARRTASATGENVTLGPRKEYRLEGGRPSFVSTIGTRRLQTFRTLGNTMSKVVSGAESAVPLSETQLAEADIRQ